MHLIPVQEAHRLCSGQVITSPADAVKELIDNSLDSGATVIQVGLTGGALQAIEVSDNGTGIREPDLDQLCAKYTTSKLTTFEDLRTIRSLGFRGEALSSLCSLSTSVRVLTKYTDDDVGFVAEYDESGVLVKKFRHPRAAGTTVTLRGLFERLIVRRKFFEKDKTVINKITNLVLDYALALPHVKFLLTDTVNSSRKELLNLPNTRSLKERIAVVIRPKPVFESLTLAEEILPDAAEEFSVDLKPESLDLIKQIEMEAVISKAGHGRSNNERQFFSVNGRPVQFVKLAKIINQVFRSYDPTGSGTQYPFFAINLQVPLEMVDVNVTPDKRTILISHENAFYALIKSSIIQLYGQDPVSLQQAKYVESCSQVTIVSEDRENATPSVQRIRDFDSTTGPLADPASKRITDFFSPSTRPSDESPIPVPAFRRGEIITNSPCTEPSSGDHLITSAPSIVIQQPPQELHQVGDGRLQPVFQTARSYMNSVPRINGYDEPEVNDNLLTRRDRRSRSSSAGSIDGQPVRRRSSLSPGSDVGGPYPRASKRMRCSTPTSADSPPTFRVPDMSHILQRTRARSEGECLPRETPTHSLALTTPTRPRRADDSTQPSPVPKRPSIRISIDVTAIKRYQESQLDISSTQGSQRFQLDVDSGASEEEAIGEMQRLLQKSDFKEMQIIGQFNRAFIVTQLGKDLLIIDQHASDERRNFDDLLENYDLEPQQLIRPQPLHLTAYQESILTSFVKKFEMNGFRFTVDGSREAGSRVSLVGVPSSGNRMLSSDDVLEMIETIRAAPSIPKCIRPSKVVEILAMKACKKSIKIGDPLTMDQMTKVVGRMAETSSPWTCAHGRPTVRFLSRLGHEKKQAVLPEVSSQDEVEEF